MPPDFDSWLPLIADARTEAFELISRIASTRQPTVGVTHNDIFPGNVLVHDGRVPVQTGASRKPLAVGMLEC